MYQGKTIRVTRLDGGIAELCFDRQGEAINKLDRLAVGELASAVAAIRADSGVRGVLVTSAKEVFIVGADINEFTALFALPAAELELFPTQSNRSFTALEDLPVPTVTAINGAALGGGLETALATDLRVQSTAAQIGLPEVKLGLIPGFGGTVRLPRVAGPQVAIDWITSGAAAGAEAARAGGVVDQVATPEKLREAALGLLQQAISGRVDWRARRALKDAPVAMAADAAMPLYAAARAQLARTAPRHQPAPLTAIELLERAAPERRTRALELETQAFAVVAKTQAAASLVQLFLNDQLLKKKYRDHARLARPLKQAAVLGAGIMGGGIAYTSALRGTAVRMKDITQQQLDLGCAEARKLLAKQVKSGRLQANDAETIMARITPQLDYAGFDDVDAVIEAVVENLGVKHRVLAELEGLVGPETVIASNTSSLRIDDLARPLQRPENFVGMHFFNPVPLMALVEVIRGSKSSATATSTIVGYAVKMGKTPIVVRDGPGFLVNRILMPYLLASSRLIADGADYLQIDQAMEEFGWPMGPNYLCDVIGMDTAKHVLEVIAAGFPERMRIEWSDSAALMAKAGRLGQKNGVGFYRYEADPAGRPRKIVAADTQALLATAQRNGPRSFTAQEIVERMMLPMIVESAHALEDGVVDSAPELDMALLLGLGFPRHLGGALKYADWLGLAQVVAQCDRHAALGPMYQATPRMREMAAGGLKYYG